MEVAWDKDILKEIACENLPVESQGVGRGTNLAVVWGMIVVLISDYILTSILVKVL